MAIQAHKMSDGSYVGHKVYINKDVSPMRFSVWFSSEGTLTDCEAFDSKGRARPVSPKAKKVLQTMFGWIVAASRNSK